MAKTLWGKVYYKEIYAGRLQEQPGGRCVFTYDSSYLQDKHPAIAHTLPLTKQPFISERGLHPFFDNLVAEGWFNKAQARALGVDPAHRFALLLGFGYDLAGAVSVIDPEPQEHRHLAHEDEATLAALSGRASLSGIQRKLLLVKDDKEYRPVRATEISTHIAKLASGNLKYLLELEYLTTLAVRALLPKDEVVELDITFIPAIKENALVMTRFDRNSLGKRTIHFEEFNQLLGHYFGDEKYHGAYSDMAAFMHSEPSCVPVEVDRLFQRILVCLLVGNTDAHFKNFAMSYTTEGLRLTPAYDLVAAAYYPEFKSIALKLANRENLRIGALLPKHILKLGEEFGITEAAIIAAVESLQQRLPIALTAIEQADKAPMQLRKELIQLVEKRWNGSFSLTGHLWSKKRSSGVKN